MSATTQSYRQFDWDHINREFEERVSEGWFTTQNYGHYFPLVNSTAAVDRHFREIVALREKIEGRLWRRLRSFQRQNTLESLQSHITAIDDKVRDVLRLISNFVLNGYNAIKTYAGKDNPISLSKLNATVSQHPENRQEFCKTRIEYIQWVLTDTYSTQIAENYIDPYLDGGGINFDDLVEWLREYEHQVEIFLVWMDGLLTDVLEELATGLGDLEAETRDLLLTYWHNGDRPNWGAVKSLTTRLMDDPDVMEFVEVLRRVHEHGGSGRDYIGLRVWVDNEDEIEDWERNFDDGYDRKQHLDPDRPEPDLRVEIIRDWSRRDEQVDDWDAIWEWASELQLAADESDEPGRPDATTPTEGADILNALVKAGKFDDLPQDAEDAFLFLYENADDVDAVAHELGVPPFEAENLLEEMVAEGVLEYDSGRDVFFF